MVVGPAQGLRAFLGGGVGRKGPVGVCVLRERHRVAAPIQARGGGEHELAHAVPVTQLQQVQRSLDIGLDVDPRILHRLPNTGTSSQVDHRVEGTVRTPDLLNGVHVGDVGELKREAGLALQSLEAIVLQPDIVGWAHVIDAVDLVPLLQK